MTYSDVQHGNFYPSDHGLFTVFRSQQADLQEMQHGFIGNSADFSAKVLPTVADKFCAALQLDQLVVVDQTHSAEVFSPGSDVPQTTAPRLLRGPQADAIILSRQESMRIALGIRTADCVPIVFRIGDMFGAIHAGWRGLAGGIIQKTLDVVVDRIKSSPEKQTGLFVIGPCAGVDSYEVKADVLECFTVKTPPPRLQERGGRLYFDLRATAAEQIRTAVYGRLQTCRVVVSPVCTIQDTAFHSFRRQKEGCGSNLSFIIAS